METKGRKEEKKKMWGKGGKRKKKAWTSALAP